MNQGSLRGRLPGFGLIATIESKLRRHLPPQETQAMSKEQADLLLQFDQGYSQVPKSKGEIFVNSGMTQHCPICQWHLAQLLASV